MKVQNWVEYSVSGKEYMWVERLASLRVDLTGGWLEKKLAE